MYHAASSVATRAFAVARWLGKERSDAMPKSLKDLVADAKTRIGEISASDTAAAAKQDPRLLIVDVREPAEWAEGHIPGALLVPRGMLEARADLEYANREPRLADRQQAIVLHCASGGRSALAADVLQAMGFTNVRSMAGGIAAWKEQGLPIEK
jgi:rhodanese-related sulfurtransferase